MAQSTLTLDFMTKAITLLWLRAPPTGEYSLKLPADYN